MYVDDLVSGEDSLTEIQLIRDEMIQLLKLGGFNIRQWASNHKDALSDMTKQFSDLNWTVKGDGILKTLGVIWDSTQDKLTYITNKPDLDTQTSKRKLLSEISKIFDPLGLLGPVILYAKLLIQDCWREKLDWDESVPVNLHTKWTTFTQQLPLLQEVKVN